MPKYSVIVPVYNRPEELRELLATLVYQTYSAFEVIVVEDGSTISSSDVIKHYQDKLDLNYVVKPNEGQGFARNFGFKQAKGEYLIVFDSDCLVPSNYLQIVDDFLQHHAVDAFGGPDAAHPSFTLIQKTISHVMTSLFTTGGIRGRKAHVGDYHPRSFNMGMHRKVYEQTKGYIIPFMAEDLEFSTRIIKSGFKTALIPEAFVYHKRRTDLLRFFKQLQYFGRARVNLTRFHPGELKLIHLFPLVFSLGLLVSVILAGLQVEIGWWGLIAYAAYLLMSALEGGIKFKSLGVCILTPLVVLIQMFGYGYGLVYEWIRKQSGIDPNTPYTQLY